MAKLIIHYPADGDSQLDQIKSVETHQSSLTELEYKQMRLLKSGDFSDMEIVCQDHTWAVHRNIVCRRCPFFRAALGTGFAGSISRQVALPEDDPHTIEMLLIYLYLLPNIFEFCQDDEGDTTDTTLRCRIIKSLAGTAVVADKYCVPGLMDCVRHGIRHLDFGISRILYPGYKPDGEHDRINELPALSNALYVCGESPGYDDLRKSFARHVRQDWSRFVQLIPTEQQQNLIMAYPLLGLDLVSVSAQDNERHDSEIRDGEGFAHDIEMVASHSPGTWLWSIAV